MGGAGTSEHQQQYIYCSRWIFFWKCEYTHMCFCQQQIISHIYAALNWMVFITGGMMAYKRFSTLAYTRFWYSRYLYAVKIFIYLRVWESSECSCSIRVWHTIFYHRPLTCHAHTHCRPPQTADHPSQIKFVWNVSRILREINPPKYTFTLLCWTGITHMGQTTPHISPTLQKQPINYIHQFMYSR